MTLQLHYFNSRKDVKLKQKEQHCSNVFPFYTAVVRSKLSSPENLANLAKHPLRRDNSAIGEVFGKVEEYFPAFSS